MPLHRKPRIAYSPREAAAAPPADPTEGSEGDGPQLFEVDGDQVTSEELVRGYKGTKETTQRFQKVSEAEKRVEAREARVAAAEQAAEERERNLNVTRDKVVDDLAEGRREASPERPGIRERVKAIEGIVGDEKDLDQLGEVLEEAMEETEQRVRRETKEELEGATAEVREELAATKAEAAKDRQTAAAERVQRHNRETMDRVLETQFSDLGELNPKQRAALDRKFRQKIGQDDYGNWDPVASEWQGNAQGAEDAVWSVPELRDSLIKAQTSSARVDGLTGRERAEAAGRSTPGRPARPSAANSNEGLVQRYNETKADLDAGRITKDQAAQRFTYDETVKLRGPGGLRDQAIAQMKRDRD